MSPSPSTWTWTVIRTSCDDTVHHLPCSPQGEPVVDHALFGKSYYVVQHNFDRGCSAQPPPEVLEKARAYTQVQFGPNLYAVTFLLSCGLPQMFENMAPSRHIVRNRLGLWCFIPKNQSVVPESWYASNPVIPETPTVTQPNEAANPVLRCPPKELALEAPSEEPAQQTPPEALSPPQSTQSTQSTKSTQSTESAKQSKTPNPDHPVTGSPDHPIPSDIMNELEDLIRNSLVCTDAQRTVLTLWILHTYTYQVSLLTPYLNISSPMEESGKSTCMTILRAFSAKPWWAAGLSPSAFKRKLQAEHPTVLLDNWHTIFRGTDKHPLTGFLLSGCDRTRDLGNGRFDLDDHFVFDDIQTFCPKAFAGLEPLPPSLARRSLPIVLQRRKPQQAVWPAIDLLLPENTHKFTSWMQAWARDPARPDQINNAFGEYKNEKHNLPGLSPHQQDSSRVLLALADTIGGHWPEKARAALQEIFHDQHDREPCLIHLLSDIRDAFAHHRNPKRIFTAELLDYLLSLDHRTWYEWSKNGGPLTAHALSRLLRTLSIYSRSQRRGEDKLRGYQQSDFLEAWERYLPHPNQHSNQQNQALSQCPTSNKEVKTKAAKAHPIATAKANGASATAENKVGKHPSRCRSKDRSRRPSKNGSKSSRKLCRNSK